MADIDTGRDKISTVRNMKISLWLVCAGLASCSLLAQQTNGTVQSSAAHTNMNAGAQRSVEASTPLVPGPATVSADNVNVRGQARLLGELIGKVAKGDTVNVIEEVLLKKSGPDEPSAWARISLPQGIPVYVHSMFVSNNTVKPRRLNFRAGPGENWSVLGTLQQGETIQEMERKGDWIKIQAPTNAIAYIAAQYLHQESAAPPVIASNEPAAAPTPVADTNAPAVAVAEPAPVAALPSEPPPVSTTPEATPTNEVAAATPPIVTTPEPQPEPEPEEPLPPRIVEREGYVRGTVSIQAPTEYGLVSLTNKRLVNYLESPSIELDLARYKGMHVIVSGEESIDPRWPNTPVIIIQRILVIQ